MTLSKITNNNETNLTWRTVVDAGIDQINANTTAIATNATNITSNDTDIATNVTNIATNATNIATNVNNAQTHPTPVSYTHLRAHETVLDLVCRLLLEKKKT